MNKTLPTKIQSLSRLLLALGVITVVTSGTGIALTQPRQVQAQEELRTITISPPTIEQPIKPGDTSEGTMRIINEGTTPLTFNVTMQDFIVEDTEGKPTLIKEDTMSNKYSAASWIAVYPTQFTVAPQSRYELRYYIKVPPNARPGGHYAAAIFRPDSVLNVSGTGTAVQTQVGTLISVVVDGPVTEKAEVSLFDTDRFMEYGPVDLKTQITNMSDLHIKPRGYITVKNMFGKTAFTLPLDERNVFPEATRDYVNTFGKKFMFGRYEATMTATYGLSNSLPLSANVAFWIIPWKIIVVLVLIIVAAILGGMYMKKKKKSKPTTSPTSETETPQQSVS